MSNFVTFCKKHPIIRTLGLIIIVFILLIVLTLYGLRIYTRHGKAVLVPDVKALAMTDAMRILNREGFRCEIVDSLFIDGAVPGSVIEQTPAGGSKVKTGRIIYLSINAYSPRMITCPRVADMSLRQAMSILESKGFSGIEIKNVPSAYPDLVVGVQLRGEDLEPGDRIPAGSKLTLLVGDGSHEEFPDSLFEEGESVNFEDIIDESWLN